MTTKKTPKTSVNNQHPDKTEELLVKVAELTTGWQRTQADFVNFRKRVDEEEGSSRKNAQVDLILQILPVLDNFRLSSQHLPKELIGNEWAKGIQHIERQFEQVLLDIGVKRIETADQHFDPNLHEAVESVASDLPANTIVDEIQAGYLFGDSVIRPSCVKVSAGK